MYNQTFIYFFSLLKNFNKYFSLLKNFKYILNIFKDGLKIKIGCSFDNLKLLQITCDS